MKNLRLVSFAILSIVLSLGIMGCKKEVGPSGPAGANGQDGNANAKTFIYNNPNWKPSTSWMDINTAFTDEQIKNNVVLIYIQLSLNSNYLMAVPGDNTTYSFTHHIFNSTTSSPALAGNCRIICRDLFGAYTSYANLPSVEFVKIVVIKSTGTTNVTGNGMIKNTREAILSDLQKANVNVDNYEEVCAYYGIEAE